MRDIVNLINYKKSAMVLGFILCLCLVGPGALRMAYGQGSLVETVGTMEISQQIDNGADRATPKKVLNTKKLAPDANAVAEPNRAPANAPGGPYSTETVNSPDSNERGRAATGVSIPTNTPAMTADTNVPEVNDFNAFKREIDRIDMSARGEDAQWLGKQEKKAELAQTMNNVVVAELRFLRKVAAATNDTNTVEAIDLVLKKRQDRLNKLVTKLENEAKEEHQQQGERQQRRPAPRTGGSMQQQGQTQTPARSTNPVQRAKDTVSSDQ
jgi:ribosome-associated translation inhibitor RaiA